MKPRLAQQFDLHPNQITDWKQQLQARAVDVFGRESGFFVGRNKRSALRRILSGIANTHQYGAMPFGYCALRGL